MKKETKIKKRRVYHKRKQLRKRMLLLFSCLLIFAMTKNFRTKKNDPNKINEIGGPKIELQQKSKQANNYVAKSTVTELTSNDENVTRAYQDSAWKITPTEQSEPHTTDFSDGSADRKEISTTIAVTCQLSPDDLIEWWLAGDGPTSVIATVSNNDVTRISRLYLTWHKNSGWLVERVEELRELPDFN